jgi:hypothetical protein
MRDMKADLRVCQVNGAETPAAGGAPVTRVGPAGPE